MKMKRIISILMTLVLCVSVFTVPVSAKEQPIKVKLCNYVNPDGKWVDSKYIKFDVDPIIIDGRTMVPIRAIAEELGWRVKWQSLGENSGKVGLYNNVPSGFDFDTNPQLLAYVYNMRKNIDGKSPSMKGDEIVGMYRRVRDTSGTTPLVEIPYNIDKVLYSGKKIFFTVNIHVYDTDLPDVRGNVNGEYIPNDFYAHIFNVDNGTELDYTYGTSGDVQPQIIDGRTLIPLRAFGEVLGLDVSWDNNTRTVIISA